ncbi:MAG: hypothetical protein JNL11_08555 [Bdellovibrionaceae bacterium]|nr:hypothetical protein [Pseudobdellovibrionaceae bacterium]
MRLSFLIVAAVMAVISVFPGCTWNASLKNLDDTSSSLSSECDVDITTSKLCTVSSAGKIVTASMGSRVTSWRNPMSATTIVADIPNGYYASQMCYLEESNLIPANIKAGVSIFGVSGVYQGGTFQSLMASSALRDAGVLVAPSLAAQAMSSQMTLNSEVYTYAGVDLPSSGGFNYRDIPDFTKDDIGFLGASCKYASRPTNNCGLTQNTILERIADCAVKNISASSWDGASQCNGGEGLWKLVTKNGSNKEVWQDQRTRLLWSSVVGSSNWCQASGNTQQAVLTYGYTYNSSVGTPIVGNGTVGDLTAGSSAAIEQVTITFSSATMFSVSGSCGGGAITSGGLTPSAGSVVTWSRANYCNFTLTQGSTNFAADDVIVLYSSGAFITCEPGSFFLYQPLLPVSYCAEKSGLNAPVGENWTTPLYVSAKGNMGRTPTAQAPAVSWRLPSIGEYKLADVNGIRFVMPDMGSAGTVRAIVDNSVGSLGGEWASTSDSIYRYKSYTYEPSRGHINYADKSGNLNIRCVGR